MNFSPVSFIQIRLGWRQKARIKFLGKFHQQLAILFAIKSNSLSLQAELPDSGGEADHLVVLAVAVPLDGSLEVRELHHGLILQRPVHPKAISSKVIAQSPVGFLKNEILFSSEELNIIFPEGVICPESSSSHSSLLGLLSPLPYHVFPI